MSKAAKISLRRVVQELRDSDVEPRSGEALDAYLDRGCKTLIRRMFDDLEPARREWVLDKLRADGVDVRYLED